MTSDHRSIRVGGNVVGSTLVTGDHNQIHQEATLTPDSVDIHRELAALRELLAALDLEAKERRKVDNALDEAADEIAEDEPDRESVGKTLVRAIETVEKVGKLPQIVETVRPHIERVAIWLGTFGAPLLMRLGL